jgi:alpha-glucosidase (family GH31 glycosyl hydrolase)
MQIEAKEQTLNKVGLFSGAIFLAITALARAQYPAKTHLAPNPELYYPAADLSAMVIFGNARFTVLTSKLLRLEWAANGQFEDHASFTFLNRRLPVPEFHTSVNGGILTIDTAALHLVYRGGSKGDRFAADNLSIQLHMNGNEIEWHPGMPDTGNLLGTARTLDLVEGSAVALEPGLVSRDGWTVVDDSNRPLFDSADFTMSKGLGSRWPWILSRPIGEHVDWYFFGYGHSYQEAMGDYVKVAGRIPLPPRFAFGNWWSRYWAYSDQDVNGLVRGFAERNIPLDVFVIDIDWHLRFPGNEIDQSGHRKGWSGYTWNRTLFPEPDTFLKGLHDRGLKVTLNLHPASGVQPWEEKYPPMAGAMGRDPEQHKFVPLQLTNRNFVQNYFDILHHPLEKQGVDFWWLDWQQEDTTDITGVNPTFWLNYLHFTDQEREGKRPLLFHRWGGMGNHRYQIGFSGDVLSSWESLKFQPKFTATAANVGYAYWSHDIGGHIPGSVDPELYARWMQWGAFSPILRTHTTKSPDAERRVWAYSEPYSDVMTDAIRLRYKWIPYIYTEARRTYDTGVAFLRPLYYKWPEADEAYNTPNEFLFGDDVIAAPVTSPMDPATDLATEDIWLPDGEWIEQSSGRHIVGPVTLKRTFSMEQIPLYTRPGAIIPMQPLMLHVGAEPVNPLIVHIEPLNDKQRTGYVLYEDASAGRDYMRGEFATTALHATRKGSNLKVTVDAVKGSYPGMAKRRAIRLELPDDWPPDLVEVNGRVLRHVEQADRPGWQFLGNTLTTCIVTDLFDSNRPVTITIARDPVLAERAALLDGFAGRMVALRRAYAQINDVWPIDDLVAAMQTGTRMTYHPDHARTEVEHLPLLIASAKKTLEAMVAKRESDARSTGDLVAPVSVSPDRQIGMERRISVARAALQSAEMLLAVK